jgi:hypothetical protein
VVKIPAIVGKIDDVEADEEALLLKRRKSGDSSLSLVPPLFVYSYLGSHRILSMTPMPIA